MIEFTFSWTAWLAVVLVQAVIHFGIIGPRNRKRQADQADRLQETEQNLVLPHDEDQSDILISSSTSLRYMYGPDATRSIAGRSSSIPCDAICGQNEPDERDTYDDNTVRMNEIALSPVSENINRIINKIDTNDLSNREENIEIEENKENVDLSFRVNAKNKTSRENGEAIRNVSDPLNNLEPDCPRSPSSVQEYYEYADDECDEDSCVDPDEEWRYKLLQYYYSPSSPSIVKMAGYPSSFAPRPYEVHADDPVLDDISNNYCDSNGDTQLISSGRVEVHRVNHSRKSRKHAGFIDEVGEPPLYRRSGNTSVSIATSIPCA